jgi:hypothetical protein
MLAIGAALLFGVGASSAQTSTLPTVTVAVTGKSMTVTGSLQSGAVNLVATTTNKSADPTLVHLNPGVTADQLLAKAGQFRDPNDVAPYGSIVLDASTRRGAATRVQTVLPAGDYLAIDTRVNPAKGAHAAFTVAQSAQPAALPAARSTIRAVEFGFKSPRTLHVGSTVRMRNDGFLVHMIAGLGVKNAKVAKRLTALLKAGKDRQAQKLGSTGFVGFLNPASHGAVAQMKLNAKPGVYVLACFMTTQDGREHTRLGMLRTIRIKR